MDPLLQHFSAHPFLASAAGVLLLAVVAFELRQRAHSAASVSPTEAVRMMNDGAVLVDIRSVNQFKDGHIAGARNVPGDQVADGAKALEKFRDKTIITCCENGITSGAAARKLTEFGFKQVFNLRGGLAGWRQDNLPVTKD